MALPIDKHKLTPVALQLLLSCGPDAQNHPLELVDGQLRFKPDPVINYIHRRARLTNLNDLCFAMDTDQPTHRLSLRRFYRDIGYSLSGYLEIFGDQLEQERKEAGV